MRLADDRTLRDSLPTPLKETFYGEPSSKNSPLSATYLSIHLSKRLRTRLEAAESINTLLQEAEFAQETFESRRTEPTEWLIVPQTPEVIPRLPCGLREAFSGGAPLGVSTRGARCPLLETEKPKVRSTVSPSSRSLRSR